MAIGRPPAGLVLNDAEREPLHRWARRHNCSQQLAERSRSCCGAPKA